MTRYQRGMSIRKGMKRARIQRALDSFDTTGMVSSWYENSRRAIQEVYGEDWKLFARILAATSPNASLATNVALAQRAYTEYKTTGKIAREGYMKSHYTGLISAIRGDYPAGPKVSAFARALEGDETAVVIDLWMCRASRLKRDTPSEFEADCIREHITAKAKANNRPACEEQAIIWGLARGNSQDFSSLIRRCEWQTT